ncbi:hypothetical protein IB262_33195 [Ensifer sp. ENS02]|uniref:hypothetical protein n=1 Tax=Ensifer sp. ENS02 TaxID=2769290 RepID=UPI00177D8419|nr:hypothetical protein [Ensifer sp. ENS02]MBD9524734.1 hypothetical protein [Ensifer sp. ENS02]
MSDQLSAVLVQPIEQITRNRAAQNLFEFMAGNVQNLPAHAGPGSVGRKWVDDLQGFFDRMSRKRVTAQSAVDDLGSSRTMAQSETVGSFGGELANRPGRLLAETDFKRLLAALQATHDANLGVMLVAGTAKRVSDGVQMLVKG